MQFNLKDLISDLKKAAKEPTPDFYSAVAVIDYSGKVLLGKRTEDGIWTTPAGGGHFPESPEQCAIRELFEEAGIVAQPEDLQALPTSDTKNNKKCYCFLYVRPIGLTVTSKLDPDQEVKTWNWYEMQAIPSAMKDDERRLTTVRNAFMKFYGISKGGEGSGVVGHKSFHEAQRDHHYNQGLEAQSLLDRMEKKVKERKAFDSSYQVPEKAKAMMNELKDKRDNHSQQFKTHQNHASRELDVQLNKEQKMKKSDDITESAGLRYARLMNEAGDEIERQEAEWDTRMARLKEEAQSPIVELTQALQTPVVKEDNQELESLRRKLEIVKLVLAI